METSTLLSGIGVKVGLGIHRNMEFGKKKDKRRVLAGTLILNEAHISVEYEAWPRASKLLPKGKIIQGQEKVPLRPVVTKDLAKKYSDKLECCENEVEKMIEEIRCKAIERGTGNENYRTTGIATIEVFLPPRLKKDRKNLLETRLLITGRELRSKTVRGGFRKWHSTHMRRRSCGSAPSYGLLQGDHRSGKKDTHYSLDKMLQNGT
ncbi:hypothetical protein H8959_008588 [Pygathrix nigripes]